MNRRVSLVGAWLAVVTAVGAGAGALSLTACTVEQEQPNLAGQDIRMTFIHTSDIHSRLFPYSFQPNVFERNYGLVKGPFGGIARIATVAKDIRKTATRSLWLDTGDCFQGAPVFNLFKGEAEMRSLSLAGMDGAVIGNHEFDLGAKNLFDKIDNWATFPIMAANYAWDDPPPGAVNPDGRSLRDVVPPFMIYDVKGIKVGVIGMANISTITSIFEGGNSLGFRPIDDEAALSGYVRLLRPQVDLVVVISHLGLDEDEDLTAAQVDDPNEAFDRDTMAGVDIVLGGHLHIVTNPPKLVTNDDKGHQTIIVHSGAFAKFVGRLDVVVRVGTDNSDPEKRSRVTSFSYDNIPVQQGGDGVPGVRDDPEVASLMWPYSVKINQEIDLNGVFAYVNADAPEELKITRTDQSGGDSQLGNLVARSMQLQEGVQAEFAITNSLGIRADFEPGPLTIEQMYNVFPFENSITVMYLSGQEVQETLDFVARRSASRGCRTQAQVSGITFDMVCNGQCPNGGTACAKNIVIGDNCRDAPDGPVVEGRCAKLNETGLYRVAVNDYIAAGGSGFEVLKRNTTKQDTGISLRDSLRVYLNRLNKCADHVDMKQNPPLVVKEKYGEISCLRAIVPGACQPDTKTCKFGTKSCTTDAQCGDEVHDGRIRPVFE